VRCAKQTAIVKRDRNETYQVQGSGITINRR
jgi:hypothetical protein